MNVAWLMFLVCLSGYCHSHILKARSVNDWTVTLYTSQNSVNGTTNLTQANPLYRSVVIIHGWQQYGTIPWILLLKDEYLRTFQINVFIVDWSADASSIFYFPSANIVPTVGAYVGNILYQLHNNNTININSTKLIGFSIGAHVAGHAGKQYFTLSGVKLPNIVALEATALGFQFNSANSRLDKTDAVIVQAFHTSTTSIVDPYGTIDVYFNYKPFHGCGVKQPGCPLQPGVPYPPGSPLPFLFCDHIRSAAYFIVSVRSNNFLAVPCTCDNFGNNACPTTAIVVGENLPPTAANGQYYLATACSPPFALGAAGLQGGSSNYIC